MDTLAEFESITAGVESAMKGGGLGPERMTHGEIFLEIKRALSPIDPDPTPLKENVIETRDVSAREKLASVSILGQTETYLNIDGVLWTFISLKTPPDGTYPGILRELMTIGFPVVVSTQATIPDQRVVLDKYKKKLRKMQAAQKGSKGNLRVDVTAQVATQELIQIQQEIIASSVKTARVSVVIGVHTSAPAWSAQQYETAERELADRRQQVLHVVARMNGARGFLESLATRRLFLSTLAEIDLGGLVHRDNSYRRQNDAHDAALLGWALILGILGILYFVAYDRLHVRAGQLIEMTIYPLLIAIFLWEVLRYKATNRNAMEAAWPRPIPHVSHRKEEEYLQEARKRSAVLLGYDIFGEPFYWSDETRTMQSNAFGMTGAGKTNLLEVVTEQDILRGVPIVFIDGKGDKKLLAELLPSIEAAGRMQDLRVIDPMRPDISARYNPFWAPEGNAEEHVGFVFESFNMEKDFFEGHQRVYLENIARVLHYSGKRFNFHDVLVCAYDQKLLKAQMKVALDRVSLDSTITRQQKMTLTMSVRNLLESFEDKERVSKIQGLINEMMTFMGDDMAMITGPYDELLSLDDVIDKGLILFLSLNVNVNERAVTALGRMLLQNLQLMIGRRYSRAQEGEHQPFVSVIMDEFSPFAYENFAHILQTARGANVAFLFALQSAPQLLQVGRGFRNDVASAPNTTFMLRTKDEETAQYFLKASARVRQMSRSMRVQKKGIFNPEFEEGTEGSQTEIKDTLAQDEHIKKMPVGQMEMLLTDPFRGTIHKHLHIKKAFSHWLPQVPMNVYPKLDAVDADSQGLNLSFPLPDLEEKRQRRRRK